MLKDIELANIQENLAKLNYFQVVLRLVKVHRLHNLNLHKAPLYPQTFPSISLNILLPPQ